MKSLFIIVVVAACVTRIACGFARARRRSFLQEWQAYKQKYGKVYKTPEEDARRFALFVNSKAKLTAAEGAESHKRGLNHLSDWTNEERMQLMNGTEFVRDKKLLLKVARSKNSQRGDKFLQALLSDSTICVPNEVDWRKVPRGHLLRELGQKNLSSLSIFSDKCSPIIRNGIESKQADLNKGSMPMLSRFSASKTSNVEAVTLPRYDEIKLKTIVARHGPVSVAIDASDLFDYESGIYDQGERRKVLSNPIINHVVLIVGYGTDPKHGDFWIVKNSWTAKWGEKGYFRLKRNNNTCNVGYYATIAMEVQKNDRADKLNGALLDNK